MSLRTRQNPQTGKIEVLVDDEWVGFDDYRKKHIDQAYQNSIRYLRERLGEDAVNQDKHEERDEE